MAIAAGGGGDRGTRAAYGTVDGDRDRNEDEEQLPVGAIARSGRESE